jgi:hypothetical protein
MKTKKPKKSKAAKKATKSGKQSQVRSKVARSHIAEGTRLFALAGRPTKADFIKEIHWGCGRIANICHSVNAQNQRV